MGLHFLSANFAEQHRGSTFCHQTIESRREQLVVIDSCAAAAGCGKMNDRTSKVFLGATVPAVEEDADAECDSSATVGTE